MNWITIIGNEILSFGQSWLGAVLDQHLVPALRWMKTSNASFKVSKCIVLYGDRLVGGDYFPELLVTLFSVCVFGIVAV